MVDTVRTAAALLALGSSLTAQETSAHERAMRLGKEHVERGSVHEGSDPRTLLVNVTELAARDARSRRIRGELRELESHEWAGSYSCGDGLGMNVGISIAPRSGVVYSWHGCAGLYDFNHGDVVEARDGRLRLQLVFDPTINMWWGQTRLWHPYMSADWFYFDWGPLRFVVPTVQMVGFCNDVNSGAPRWAAYPHRALDESRRLNMPREERPAGLPTVPPDYRPFLLVRPLNGAVVQADEPIGPRTVDPDYVLYEVNARVDLGTNDGLLPGMVLHLIEPDRTGEGEAFSVGERESRVAFRFKTYDRYTVVPGTRVSTRVLEADLQEELDSEVLKAR